MYYIVDKDIREKVYAALAMPDREFRQRLSFGSWQTTNGIRSFVVSANSDGAEMIQESGIIKLDITQQGNSNGSGLVMGCCCSSLCSTEFYNIDKSFNYGGKVLFAECGIKLEDESFFYVPVGYFTIDKPQTDDDWRTVSLSAYDDIARMTAKWSSTLTYPSTAEAILEEITGKYGIAVEFANGLDSILAARTVTESEAASLTAYTEREVCGFIAGLVGANARMNTVGAMKIDWYASPSSSYAVEITAEVQWQNGFKKTSEDHFEISSITSGIDDKVFTAGTGKGISFANPIITQSEITAIYALYKGITFQPCDCEWRGNPCVECGDIVTVSDKNGVEYTVFVANQEIDLTGGLSMVISCPGGDAEISFDTVNEQTRTALNRQKTDLQQAITKATNAINGQNGGFLEINDTDGDGNPDELLIKQDESGTTGVIRINAAGIGLSDDGGSTYRTAITFDGMNADEIVTGVLHADRIPNVTADKLAVGTATEANMFNNAEFTEAYQTTTDTGNTYDKIVGWATINSLFVAKENIGRLFAESTTEYGFKQAVWMPKGKYAFIFKIKVINPIGLGSNPDLQIITPRGTGSFSQTKIDSDTVTNGMNSDVVFKIVFNNTKEASFSEVGIKFIDLDIGIGPSGNYGCVDVDWAILAPTDEDGGFYCSNTSWLVNDREIRDKYTIPYYADADSYFRTINPFQVNESGNLKVVEGQIGGFDFSEYNFKANSYVYGEGVINNFLGNFAINIPHGSIEPDNVMPNSNSLEESFSPFYPHIEIQEINDPSIFSYYGLSCTRHETSEYRTSLHPYGLDTTGYINAASVKSSNAYFVSVTVNSSAVSTEINENGLAASGNVFSGIQHTRKNIGTVKLGADTLKNYTSVAIEATDTGGEITARLDVINDPGYAMAQMFLTGEKGQSAPLALGTDDFWFNGNPVYSVLMNVVDDLGGYNVGATFGNIFSAINDLSRRVSVLEGYH